MAHSAAFTAARVVSRTPGEVFLWNLQPTACVECIGADGVTVIYVNHTVDRTNISSTVSGQAAEPHDRCS